MRLIVANWKMLLDDKSSIETACRLAETVRADIEIVICPPFTAIAAIAEALRGSRIALGAQDCAWEERGAFTGEVSPADLRVLGCRYVIVGHSERRRYLYETDSIIAKKLRAALKTGLRPIFCVGETLEEKKEGLCASVLVRQLAAGVRGLELLGTQRLIIAYEPVWAIGTGQAATPGDAAQAFAIINESIHEHLGAAGAKKVCVLYGGSVDPSNVRDFISQSSAAGVLVGTASQTAARLRNIIHAVQS